MPLRPASEVIGQARAILEREQARLADLLADQLAGHELVLIGGSSVPGALTKGDVDLHLRVAPGDFDRTVTVLRGIYQVVHPEIWQPSLATFAVEAPLPTGVAVTPAGSEHDLRFTRSWQLLAAEPALLSDHNAVKRRCEDLGAEYERQKSAFFGKLVELWPDHPAGGGRTQADTSA
jgi:GrpB-like predicted nucleotidyltransferase (UPF0157 family)